MTLEYVVNHPDEDRFNKWSLDVVAQCANINFQDVQKYPEFFDNDIFMCGLTMNPNITADIILNNPEYNWKFEFLCYNPSITIHDLEKFEGKINIKKFSGNPNITLEWVDEHLDDVDWYDLSNNVFLQHRYFLDNRIIIRI